MARIHELADENLKTFLELPIEELAGLLLEDLVQRERNRGVITRGDYCRSFRSFGDEAARAVAEAWAWLEQHACLALDPKVLSDNLSFVTRRGKELFEHLGDNSLITEELTFRELLHPTIVQKSWSAFIRGQNDSAIFEAMKQVEISVREAGGFAPSDLGIVLMRNAFNVDDGPLTDDRAEPAEKQALSDLFAGAIGSYKNPHSHRNVAVDRQDAMEVLTLASHLLRIVDSRRPLEDTGQESEPTGEQDHE